LLFEKSAEEVRAHIAAAVVGDTGISLYDDHSSSEEIRRLLFNGVEIHVEACDPPHDLAAYRRIFSDADLSKIGSAIGLKFGPSVSGGEKVAPIAQTFLNLTARLTSVLRPIGVSWTPARLLSDPSYFCDAVRSYVEDGPFPILSTINFLISDDMLRSNGLTWFSSQELELAGHGKSSAELIRRAVRIVHDVAVNGPVLTRQVVPDVEDGWHAVLAPSQDGATVSVKIQSKLELSPTS
jgi:hypothetical protein